MENKKLAVRADVLQAKPVSLSLEEAVGTGIQQASKHYDLVLGIDFHWTSIPFVPVPLPLPHPFVGIIFDPIDYLHFDIPIPSFFQSEGGPTSIPMGGTVLVHQEHKATTTTSVMGVAVFGRHVTDLPGYKIVNMPGSPHDGEVYFGSQTVFAQEAELSGDQTQHVLTCWCPPMGLTALPNAPMKLSKNPMRYFAFYNHRLSAYIQIPGGDPVLVGGTFIPHQYSASELLMRFAAMGLMKGAGGLMKTFNKHVLRKLLGSRNPLSRALCFLGFDPINLVTGGLLFDWDDFEIGGNIPISWSNTYYSNYQLPMGSFGAKTFNCWDLMILPDLEQEAAAWMNPQERIVMSIPWVEVGAEPTYYRPYKISYHRPDESTWVLRQNQHTYYYQKMTHPTAGELYKCTQIAYNDGSVFTLSYQGTHRLLHRIETQDGRVILCQANQAQTHIEQVFYQKGALSELQVRYQYDDQGNITQVWDRKNKAIVFEYNHNNLLVKRTNRNGMQYVFRYDNHNRVIYTSGKNKFQEAQIIYHEEEGYNEVIYSAHPDKREEYHYDENNLVYKKVDGEGGETWYDYTAHLERQLISSPNGKTLGYKFDKQGNIAEMVMADGQSHTYTYNDQGQLTHRLDARGNIEHWQYDKQQRLCLYLNPLGQAIRYVYEEEQRLPSQLYRGEELVATYTYNAANQLVLLQEDQTVQQWEYDTYGRLLGYKPKESVAVRLERDDLGRVSTWRQTHSPTIEIGYDAYDLPIAITDGELQMELDYTPMGSIKRQLSYATHDKKHVRALHYAYDAYENLTGITNEKNEHYRFTLNKRDEVIEEIEFDGTRKSYCRDADGQVTQLTDSQGRVVSYQYDIAGRLAHITYDDGQYEAYYYDENGLLIEAENQHSTVQYSRNALGQVTQEKQGDIAIDYRYNDKGQLVGVGSSLGADISYGYNDYGALTQIDAFNARQGVGTDRAWQAVMQYTAEGQVQQQAFSAGVQSEFEYDHLGRMTSQKIQVGKRKPQLQKSYHWNSQRKLTQVVNELTGRRTLYQYDEFGGLAASKFEEGQVQYKTPDAVGNIYESKHQKDRVYDTGGKLLRDRQWYYHYDERGNLQLKTKRKLYASPEKLEEKPKNLQELYVLSNKWNLLEPDWEDTNFDLEEDNRDIANTATWWKGDWHYKWSSNGMLERVRTPTGDTVHLEYDALGRRTAKIVNQTIYRYIWDGDVLLHEWHYPLSERPVLEVKADGQLGYSQAEPLDHLVTWVYEKGSYVPCGKIVDGKHYSILSDYIGRPIQAYSEEGELVWRADYDIYGKLRNLVGNRMFIPFRQLGQYEDIELDGLYYNRFRYYDSNSGLYISKDPIGLAGNNPTFYAYVWDSNREVDVFGLIIGNIRYPITGRNSSHVPQRGIRNTAINRAWKLEQDLLNAGHPGTRNWTADEIELIKSTPSSDLRSVMTNEGYTGHHINSVENNGKLGKAWEGDPRNIIFLQNGRNGKPNEHVRGVEGHNGHFHNATQGELLDRKAMLEQHLKQQYK